jgi:glycosyltransferase involved in cell wall biosynthesis
MNPRPLVLPVSLVIPAFRAEAQIAAAIASVTAGDHVPAEIVVVDDASPDRTGEIAAALGARVLRLPCNAGPAAARNAGVAAATQPWVAFLDADDAWLDGKLSAQWEALQRWPGAGLCFTDYDTVFANGHVRTSELCGDADYARVAIVERANAAVRLEPASLARAFVRSMFVRQSSVLVERALYLRLGGYDEELRLAEDYEFFLRLIGAAPAVAIERRLVAYRRQATSLSDDPLAQIASIDRLWSAALARPERYSAATVEQIRRQRPATLRKGCVRALFLGRFPAAADFARRALALRRSALTAALLGLASVLDSRPGRLAFRAVRVAWRARPRSLRRGGAAEHAS